MPATASHVSSWCLGFARPVTVAENLERDTNWNIDIVRTVNRYWQKTKPWVIFVEFVRCIISLLIFEITRLYERISGSVAQIT